MESKKYNKLVNITKKKADSQIERKGRRGNRGVEE